MTKILITDAGYKHTLGAVRYLAQEGFEVDAIGSNHSLSGWSRYLGKIAYNQSDFCDEKIEQFLTFLSNSSYDILLPIGAQSIHLIARYEHHIKQYCKVPIAPREVISSALDKITTAKIAQSIGINTPHTWNFSSLDDLRSHIEKLEYPLVIKGKHELSKSRPLYVYNKKQLNTIIKTQMNTWLSMGTPMLQTFIQGTGCGFFALYQQGQCKRVFMHRRIRETPPSGGASSCAESIFELDLMDAGMKLLDNLKWHGVAMVEFKREDKTGKLFLMEINPKFWGSLDLALASGVNFPALAARIAQGEDIPYSKDYQIGLKFHWPLNGEIRHMTSNPKATFSILLDGLDPRVKSNIWINDPLPSLYSLYVESKHLGLWLLEKIGLKRFIYRIQSNGIHIALHRLFVETTGIPTEKYSKINSHIYVGAQYSKVGKYMLKQMGIENTINMRSEFDDKLHGLTLKDYCHIPTDEFDTPTIEQLNKGVTFIHQNIQNGNKVYIHCKEGVSRAPTMVVAYFISQKLDLNESIKRVKKSRPFINILPVQMEQLRRFQAQQQY